MKVVTPDPRSLMWLSIIGSIPAFTTAFTPQKMQTRAHTSRDHIGGTGTFHFSNVYRPPSFQHQFATTARHAATKTKTIDEPYTVQILMSDTGGGHRASANALRDAFDVLYPGQIQCDIVDIYTDYGPYWPYNAAVPLYKIMAKYDFLWEAFYRFGETEFGLWLNEVLLEFQCFNAFVPCLARPSGSTDKRADMVVSVHPLCQFLPLKILASLDSSGKTRDFDARTTPFCTVVTDLGGAHPTWFHPKVDKCFVPSDVLNKAAQKRGLKESQITQYGLPIRKGFWSTQSKTPSKTDLRTQLGIDPSLPTALVVGGGDGMGGIVNIAKAMGDKLGASGGSTPSYQIVVVCGNNEQAKDELKRTSFGPGVKVSVQGFVQNMDEWMNASDALVTKAGPGTIAEASICGLPCMLFAYLPGQEEGNVPFVENSGFGKYSGDPAVIADTINNWLSSPETMESMRNSALAAARPEATLDIAQELAQVVFSTKTEKSSQSAVSAAQ